MAGIVGDRVEDVTRDSGFCGRPRCFHNILEHRVTYLEMMNGPPLPVYWCMGCAREEAYHHFEDLP